MGDKEDKNKRIITPEEIFGEAYKNFKFENGIFKPEHYTSEYKSALLGDYGLGSSVSTTVLFAKKFTTDEIKELLRPYQLALIFKKTTEFARKIDLNGLSKVVDDPLQMDIVGKAVEKAKSLGLSLQPIDRNEFKHSGVLSYQTIHGLLALILSLGLDGGGTLPIEEDPRNFCLAILAINDHVIGPPNKFAGTDPNFHFENLRDIWLKAPLAGSGPQYLARMHRLVCITEKTITLDKTGTVEKSFKDNFGVSLREFHRLIPPLNTSWLTRSDSELATINCKPLDAYPHVILNKYLSMLSLIADQHSEAVRRIETEKGEDFLTDNRLLLHFVKAPFLKAEEGLYLLLAPHLLLRNLELSLVSGFLSQKQKKGKGEKSNRDGENKVRDLYGPLGVAAQNYTRELIDKCISKYRGKDEIGGVFKDSNNDEIGDQLILHPQISVLFEIKNSQPNFTKAFEPSLEGLEEFKRWFSDHYLRSRNDAKKEDRQATPGALHQLERDCLKLLNGEIDKFKPKYVLPVIVNPQNLICHVDFYNIIELAIKEQGLFTDQRMLMPLVLGIGDLEYIYGLDLSKVGMSLREILIEKQRDPAGRLSTWPYVLRKLGFTFKQPDDFMETADKLIKEAIEFLKLPKK